MFGTNAISGGSTVNNNNNRVNNSGNTNYIIANNVTVNASTDANEAPDSAPENFEEFKDLNTLPFDRNPNFCGRKEILDKLRAILEPSDLAEAAEPLANTRELGADVRKEPRKKIVVLYGLGGIEKSQFAMEYAYKYYNCYTAIFWIDAIDSSRMISSACDVAEKLVNFYANKRQSTLSFPEIAKILGVPGKIDSSGKIDKDAAIEAGPYMAFDVWKWKMAASG
ncbi:hypothetical protein RUND412_010864 [Rhizina undulata]